MRPKYSQLVHEANKEASGVVPGANIKRRQVFQCDLDGRVFGTVGQPWTPLL